MQYYVTLRVALLQGKTQHCKLLAVIVVLAHTFSDGTFTELKHCVFGLFTSHELTLLLLLLLLLLLAPQS